MLSVCKFYFLLFLFFSCLSFSLSLNFLILDYSVILEYDLLSLNSACVIMTILFDWMSLMFMSFVLFISSMVIYYSEDYMSGDLTVKRFILLVVLFVCSMMLLIISPNLISILLGWDGLGLVSYCLVIYYQNVKSFSAGMLTALSNRVGDVALLMSIAWMMNYGSWSFIYYLEFMKNDFSMILISGLVVLAAFTKSAQIPFSSWLPAAMAAPTPVSSLVHSSTLVTAGVYLLIRFSFAMNETVMFFGLLVSCLTMFMSGLGANFEYDLKKIIALSTLSQLGLMMSILFIGDYKLAFFHLLIHALFKALLFMCAGNVIHLMGNYQDIRYMGSLMINLPLTCCFFNVCNFSLCGLPFLSGFYSKDLIVEFMSMQFLNLFIYFMFYLSIGFTVMYTFRLSYYSLSGDFNFNSLNSLFESKNYIVKGMFGLIILVLFSGSFMVWLLMSKPYFICLPFTMKLMTLFMILIGMWMGYELSHLSVGFNLYSLYFLSLSSFLGSMWNLPIISTLGVNYYSISSGMVYLKTLDQGWLEFYGGQSLKKLGSLSLFLQFVSTNHLKIYFILMVFWVIFLLMNI
uniref:NADH dehydrogenase subunit 5 n=1 Tax=Distenia punctulatoides TaxID=2980435 RepID=UPI0021D52BB9|nr:NADH dehydrogenase subunit 5 [Distenia punctulatoides]UXG19098.1 NADH dehydrogenase subunit 5 [Distenia punctulatoides]